MSQKQLIIFHHRRDGFKYDGGPSIPHTMQPLKVWSKLRRCAAKETMYDSGLSGSTTSYLEMLAHLIIKEENSKILITILEC